MPDALPLGTYTFHDAEAHGTESLSATDILSQSSNIGTIEIAQQLGKTRLLDQIGNLGFGQPTGLHFPGESEGLVPSAASWTGSSIGSTPIGQADAVTVQQVLDAYNAVANGGVFVAPRLVRGTVAPNGSVKAAPASSSHRVIDPTTNAELVSMLEAVVNSGTGVNAAIDGYTVAGKDGHGPDTRCQSCSGMCPAPSWARSPVLPRPRTRCCRLSSSSTTRRRSTAARWPRRSSPPSFSTHCSTTGSRRPRRRRRERLSVPSAAPVASKSRPV